jgi:hypothetical protein
MLQDQTLWIVLAESARRESELDLAQPFLFGLSGIDAGASPSKSKMQAWRQGYDISTWKNFKSTFNSEVNRVVEIFWKQRFLIYLVCKVLYDCKELQI